MKGESILFVHTCTVNCHFHLLSIHLVHQRPASDARSPQKGSHSWLLRHSGQELFRNLPEACTYWQSRIGHASESESMHAVYCAMQFYRLQLLICTPKNVHNPVYTSRRKSPRNARRKKQTTMTSFPESESGCRSSRVAAR